MDCDDDEFMRFRFIVGVFFREENKFFLVMFAAYLFYIISFKLKDSLQAHLLKRRKRPIGDAIVDLEENNNNYF